MGESATIESQQLSKEGERSFKILLKVRYQSQGIAEYFLTVHNYIAGKGSVIY